VHANVHRSRRTSQMFQVFDNMDVPANRLSPLSPNNVELPTLVVLVASANTY
jgi:hypothetical protein